MWIRRRALEEMMIDIVSKAAEPQMEAVREVLNMYARLDERVNYAERVARLETRLEDVEDRLRESR